MKHICTTNFFVYLLLFSGCSQKKDSPLEEVLRLAGSNRSQLEQVITHYSTNSEDSLKLKAAEFLIINMPGKYSESYYTPKWKNLKGGHHWNSVSDSTAQYISFMGTEVNPYKPHLGNTLLKGKVYRKTFGHNRIINEEDEKLPPFFRNNLIDVSSEHKNMANAVILVKSDPNIPTDHIFLASLYNQEWHLAGHGELYNDSARFHDIGKEIFYSPVYYTDDILIPACPPFYIDNRGKTHILINDRPDSMVAFQSITTEDDQLLIGRMVNAVFETSTNPDFTETNIIYKINEIPQRYNKVKLKVPVSCRYIRYKTPKYSYANVSEITFYDTSGNKLEGINMVSAETESNSGSTGDKAFDGDITTFFDAKGMELESWTGLDFGENKKIASIQYSPRLLGVGIYEGYEYELFQWTDNHWKPIDKKVAINHTLNFNTPQNTLLYIRNNTTKKKGDPFFISNETIFY